MISIDKNFPYIHFLSEDEVFAKVFKEATDEELQLIKLTAPELAHRHQDAKIRGDEAECILIQHYLNHRLASLQARASMKASYIGLAGAILGFILGSLSKCH